MPDSPVTDIPNISAIIATCNSEKFIRPCLDSIFKQGRKDLEVIIVDNGSRDGTVEIIKENFPGITLIENTVNLGAAQARNQGINFSKGKWVLALDCDTVLAGDFLSKIIRIIDRLPSGFGMLQPKILNPDKQTIYSCGIHLAWSRRFYDIGSKKYDRGQFSRAGEIFGPCSAAALYNRQMLEEVKEDTGYFDRRFFFLVEDVDLAWRAGKKGWRCMSDPEAVCYHHGESSSLTKEYRQYLNLRNRYLAILKNDGALQYLSKLLPLVLYDLPRLFYLMLVNPFVRSSLFNSPFGEKQHDPINKKGV